MYPVTSNLLSTEAVQFEGLKPSHLVEEAGVYVLLIESETMMDDSSNELNRLKNYLKTIGYNASVREDCLLYVGRTINKRVRLYQNHLQGTKSTARLKVALVENGIVPTERDAKDFIKQYCSFKFFPLSIQTISDKYNFKLAEHQVKVDLQPVFID